MAGAVSYAPLRRAELLPPQGAFITLFAKWAIAHIVTYNQLVV
jgi:hypothetical protein